MPIYEYRCDECSTCYEVLIRTEDEDVKCPSCGSRRRRRIISRVATPAGRGAAGEPACDVKAG